MNIPSFPSPVVPIAQSAHVLLSSPVGEESTELQQSTLKPVEQASAPASSNHSLSRHPNSDTQPLSQQQEQQAEQAVSDKLERKEAEQERIDQAIISQLAARDREVRNHEQAHAAAGGPYAGAPKYQFQRGPDGMSYAIGGEVSIDTSPISGDPGMTIEKAQVIKRAALAPAEPSPQDRAVAAEATQMEMQARAELMDMQRQERLDEQSDKERDRSEVAGPLSTDAINSIDSQEHSAKVGLNTDPVEAMNQTQEVIFNEINKDLTAQLVSIGGVQQVPQSLGSIINRLV